MSDGQTRCSANTASITKIDLARAAVTRVVTHLPSLIAPDGTANGGSGVQDVAFHGVGNGYMTVGLGLNPTLRADHFGDAGAHYGRLGRFGPSGNFRLLEDLAGYEADNNPDGFVPDSNPYGLLALPGRVVVADAGGNDLLQSRRTARSLPWLSSTGSLGPDPAPRPSRRCLQPSLSARMAISTSAC